MKKQKYQPTIQPKEQYYVKRGRKYYPVNDPGAYDGLGKGAWMVIVEPSSKSIRTQVQPKFVELDAALRYLEDGLCKAMTKASEMRPHSVQISKKEKKAWDAFQKIIGKDIPRYFEYPSHWEIVNSGCEYLRKIMLENNMNVDKIKEKYGVKKKEVKNVILDLGVE